MEVTFEPLRLSDGTEVWKAQVLLTWLFWPWRYQSASFVCKLDLFCILASPGHHYICLRRPGQGLRPPNRQAAGLVSWPRKHSTFTLQGTVCSEYSKYYFFCSASATRLTYLGSNKHTLASIFAEGASKYPVANHCPCRTVANICTPKSPWL